ncbi:carbohydrate kinase family protein [Flavihumibacter rivuli]|uniref:carbohydrate kinase family protein n=1 Tax=Flavihumibacter rivuli TaxID=2838156 RepID=UPI001BDE7B6F|nr:carbohydrate kinase family protein [Flavihumibacter rivuli]ULQ55885.1 carbohydrate kinase family protein [Flavihumibacter rivuli]
MHAHHIAILGGTTFDHIVYLPDLPRPEPHTIHQARFNEGTGSTGSGKALALTRLGMQNTLYSVVGDDAWGEKIRDYLAAQGVQTIVDLDPAGTERHINIMDQHGGRISMFITQSSERIAFNEPAVRQLLERSSVIVLNIIAYCRHLIPLLKGMDKPVWTDLHDYDGSNAYHQDFIDAAQYIHLSSDNLPDYKATMQQLIERGKELVICTHGKQGASLLTRKGEWLEQPALPNVDIVDSNGAGDSFFSGFLFAYLQDYPLQKCLQYGAVCGAIAVTSPALVHEQLSPEMVEEKLKAL